MKNVLFVLLGAVAMFVILKMFTGGKNAPPSQTTADFKKLLKTDEAENLVKTSEFRAVLLTPEFRKLLKGIADQYLTELTKVV